ncbi:hypothetical protein CDAR_227631 [Caerostris darwini]|uniref:Uncharacterized protein n=1 Tax=Caerostris darwini TaxID=1538125 RepID=A0AAV4T437_9ARAC|nr:hypothetical protein CDAR_227631 [Caerostris darwini]
MKKNPNEREKKMRFQHDGNGGSPDDSQGLFQGRISPAAPEQHPQPRSPDAICSTLQSIESEISSHQEELASYQMPPIRNDGLVSKCHGARGTEDLNTSTKGKANWFLPKV